MRCTPCCSAGELFSRTWVLHQPSIAKLQLHSIWSFCWAGPSTLQPFPRLCSSCSSRFSLDFRPTSEACTAPCPVRFPFLSFRYRFETDRTFSATDQKKCVRLLPSTGLVLGERFRALIGFVYPARNGTASATAAAGLQAVSGCRSGTIITFDWPPPLLPPGWLSVLSVSLPWISFLGLDVRPTSEACTAPCQVRFPFLSFSLQIRNRPALFGNGPKKVRPSAAEYRTSAG